MFSLRFQSGAAGIDSLSDEALEPVPLPDGCFHIPIADQFDGASESQGRASTSHSQPFLKRRLSLRVDERIKRTCLTPATENRDASAVA
jgi:hypothetical protein